jgi:hypothetical protein
MNTSKIIILSTTVLVILSMILLVGQLLLPKLKTAASGKAPTCASGIWFITLFLSGAFLTSRTVPIFSEAIDNTYKINLAYSFFTIFKTGSMLIGISLSWLIIWYFLSNTLSVIITGKKNALQEAESNNTTFFLIRGAIMAGFTVCLLPVFELILRTFIPHINTPFYH